VSDNFQVVTGTTTRKTADERRIDILEAARVEFALKGLYGASTDTIARRAGISQPYLFRLFGTKKELFLACMQECLDQMHDGFLAAAGGLKGKDALDAIGEHYTELLVTDPTQLQAQMQGYAAAGDPDVREVIRRGFGRIVETAERISGEPTEVVSQFFATGMLLNVLAMMGELAQPDAWAERLAEGCRT
jgi:AcrR family transcriptional regulator